MRNLSVLYYFIIGVFLLGETPAIRKIFYMWSISIAKFHRLRNVARDLIKLAWYSFNDTCPSTSLSITVYHKIVPGYTLTVMITWTTLVTIFLHFSVLIPFFFFCDAWRTNELIDLWWINMDFWILHSMFETSKRLMFYANYQIWTIANNLKKKSCCFCLVLGNFSNFKKIPYALAICRCQWFSNWLTQTNVALFIYYWQIGERANEYWLELFICAGSSRRSSFGTKSKSHNKSNSSEDISVSEKEMANRHTCNYKSRSCKTKKKSFTSGCISWSLSVRLKRVTILLQLVWMLCKL